MAALIPGYEYDIFISYRHKDNKYDKWVTRFVSNLKKELEATFKDPVSVYFDENPNDGLLESHNVDSSLSSKIKSLIFIPVLSQTYCDINSFAWKQEFIPFNTLSLNDSFGREIKLPNGNVANRILPVKIHDLDTNDEKMIYDIMNHQLRSIEFIYSLPGVNRPLMPEDDGRGNNPYFYRDQINKVANASKELIMSMRGVTQPRVNDPLAVLNDEITKNISKPTDRQLSFRVRIIQQVEIFSLLSDKYLEEVAAQIETLNLQENASVFEKGDIGDAMFIIVDGKVKVHDQDHVFSFLSGGDCFGEYTLIDEIERSASVTAIEPTMLYKVDQQVFQSLIKSNPPFINSVLRVLITRLRKLDTMQQELASSYQTISQNSKVISDSRKELDTVKSKLEAHKMEMNEKNKRLISESLSLLNGSELKEEAIKEKLSKKLNEMMSLLDNE